MRRVTHEYRHEGVGLSGLVSLVMPVYNGATYVAEAIESVRSQTYPHWELIIVDDASSDRTPEIIGPWPTKDPRIRVVRNAVNRKLPASLNVGFSHSQGEFSGWIAADDLYHPEAVAAMVQALNSPPRPDLVYTDFAILDAAGHVGQKTIARAPESLATANGIGPCRLYRRHVHERLRGYDESLFTVEDYDFMLRAFCLFKLQRVPQSLYFFRIHPGGLTTTQAEKVRWLRELVKEKNLPSLKQRSRRLAARCHLSIINSCLLQGQHWRAARHALGAVQCDPVSSLRHDGKLLLQGLLGPAGSRVVSKVCRVFAPARGGQAGAPLE